MRFMPILFLAACAARPAITQLVVVEGDLEGRVMLDADSLLAGMGDQVCRFDLAEGALASDVELGSGERVLDRRGDRTLVRVQGGLHVLKGDELVQSDALDVVDARLLLNDTVAVTDDCTVRWGASSREVGCSVPLAFDADPRSGTVALAAEDGLRIVPVDGTIVHFPDVHVDRLAWDEANERLLIGRSGEPQLTSLSATSQDLWTIDLGAPLHDVVVASESGHIAVTLDGTPNARFAMLDAEGNTLFHAPVPELPELALSPDGTLLALVTPHTTFVYSVDPTARGRLPSSSRSKLHAIPGLGPEDGVLAAAGVAALFVAVAAITPVVAD